MKIDHHTAYKKAQLDSFVQIGKKKTSICALATSALKSSIVSSSFCIVRHQTLCRH